MKTKIINVENFPSNVLKVDDWFAPTIGELCIDAEGKLNIVKNVSFVPAKDPFKAYVKYSFKIGHKEASQSFIYRVYVKKGKTFEFNNKTFKFKEATEGDIIDNLAKENIV